MVRVEPELLFVVWLLFVSVSVFGMVFSVATLASRPLSIGPTAAGAVVIMADDSERVGELHKDPMD